MNSLVPPVFELSEWYLKFHRKLPWRETLDPYLIWVSEVMLQQTQVKTVIPHYLKFIERFPTLRNLSEATESEVYKYWSGLGYYRRAQYLHRGARQVMKIFNGQIPSHSKTLLGIPGIGPYTAGAILSIAFNQREALVDGNVERVFSRFYGIRNKKNNKKPLFWEYANRWVLHADSPRILNQALMELGATVCVKGNPRCMSCPISSGCFALRHQLQDQLPTPKTRKKTKKLWWIGIIIEYRGKFWVNQFPHTWCSSMWSIPTIEVKQKSKILPAFHKFSENLPTHSWRFLGLKRHTITHHDIHVMAYELSLSKKSEMGGRWISPQESQLPISTLTRKVLSLI